MKTLAQLKSELGVTSIQFLKSLKTGREFATVGNTSIIIASNCNKTQPLFVIFNDEKQVYVVCNSGVETGSEL